MYRPGKTFETKENVLLMTMSIKKKKKKKMKKKQMLETSKLLFQQCFTFFLTKLTAEGYKFRTDLEIMNENLI